MKCVPGHVLHRENGTWLSVQITNVAATKVFSERTYFVAEPCSCSSGVVVTVRAAKTVRQNEMENEAAAVARLRIEPAGAVGVIATYKGE